MKIQNSREERLPQFQNTSVGFLAPVQAAQLPETLVSGAQISLDLVCPSTHCTRADADTYTQIKIK